MMMLAYSVQLPLEGEEPESAMLLCRTLDQANRVKRAQAQAQALVSLVVIDDRDTIDFLLSEDCEGVVTEYIAWRKLQVN